MAIAPLFLLSVSFPELVEHSLQVIRQLAKKFHPAPILRMLEHQSAGMQKRTL
jgi:hypothetical protein